MATGPVSASAGIGLHPYAGQVRQTCLFGNYREASYALKEYVLEHADLRDQEGLSTDEPANCLRLPVGIVLFYSVKEPLDRTGDVYRN